MKIPQVPQSHETSVALLDALPPAAKQRKPLRLARLQQKDPEPRWLEIPFGHGESAEILDLCYDRALYTPELEKEMQEQIKENLMGGMLVKYIMKLVLAWRVEQPTPETANLPEDQQEMVPFPLTEENLTRLIPIRSLNVIADAMAEDQIPPKK